MTKEVSASVKIPRPNIQVARFEIVGTAPFVANRFSIKAQNIILESHIDPTKKSKKNRTAKNISELFEGSLYKSSEGWYGIHAASFRSGLISACRLIDYKMTLAKLSLFVFADGLDAQDGTPLVRIYGKPEQHIGPVRNASGVIDMRVRAMFREWKASVNIKFDADQFSLSDVAALMERVGTQVGIGEGRNDSRKSNGCGWGSFALAS